MEDKKLKSKELRSVLGGRLTTNDFEGRYYYVDWSATQSIPENNSTINWTLGCDGGSSSYYYERTLKLVIDGQEVFAKTDSVQRYKGNITSGSIVLNHNNEGNRGFGMSLECATYYSYINITGNGYWDLNQIARYPQMQSATNFNDEQNPSISFTNPAKIFPIRAKLEISGNGNFITRDIGKTLTSYTFNLTENERNRLREVAKNTNNLAVRFTVCAMEGDRELSWSLLDRTMTIINANPTITATAKDTLQTSLALTGNENTIIRGVNNIAVSMTATPKKKATIVSQKISCGTKSITTLTGNLVNADSNEIVFTTTDSRGNTTTQKITKTLIPYIFPTCNLVAENPTTEGKIAIKLSGNYYKGSFGKVANSLTLQIRQKENYGNYGAWQNVLATINDNNTYNATATISGLDYRKTYTFQARIIDKIKTIESNEKRVKTIPIFDFGENDFRINGNLLVEGNINGIKLSDILPVTLYESSIGTTGDVTLSDNASKYSYIEIFYKRSETEGESSVKISSPNGKRANLSLIFDTSAKNSISFHGTTVQISETLITVINAVGYAIYSNFSWAGETHKNEIKIMKVIGYK